MLQYPAATCHPRFEIFGVEKVFVLVDEIHIRQFNFRTSCNITTTLLHHKSLPAPRSTTVSSVISSGTIHLSVGRNRGVWPIEQLTRSEEVNIECHLETQRTCDRCTATQLLTMSDMWNHVNELNHDADYLQVNQ